MSGKQKQLSRSENGVSGKVYRRKPTENRTWVKRSHQFNLGDVYRYDAADQLTNVIFNVTNPDGTPSGGTNDTRYVFDAAGNRTSLLGGASRGQVLTISI